MKAAISFAPIILLFSLAANVAHCQKVGIRSSHALACWMAAQQWDFGCDNKIPCLCQSTPYLGSVLDCVRDRLEEEPEINDAYQFVQNQCKYNGHISYTFGKLDDIYFNATLLTKNSNGTNTPPKSQKMTVPVDIDQKEFDSHYPAAYAAKRQYDLGTKFGCGLIGYWFFMAFIGMVSHSMITLYPELVSKNHRIITKIRQYFILPALFGDKHSRPVKLFFKLSLTAPTRGQSLILFGYFVLNFVSLFFDYNLLTPNPFLVNRMDQRLRYLGNRSGVISFTQLPLVILFAGRNNILIKHTGWSYNTFQVYHRWVARVMIIHAIIHAVCFTWLAIVGHTVAYRWQDVINWRAGNIAAYISIIMFLLSLGAFRSRFYEIFLFTHKCMYIIFIVGIARHCIDFGWMGWVYASIGIHVIERLLRLGRVIVSGSRNEAYAEIFPDDAFRLSVAYSKRWDIGPGQYCYLRILTKDLFWQAHPFSIYKSPTTGDDTIHFAIKAKKGATKTIAQKLKKQINKTDVFSVLIEGPYGVHSPVENYEIVFLLAGGMGVTATYAYAQYLQKVARRGQRVVFLWVIKDTSPLEWFGEEILSLAHDPSLDVQIYITQKLKAAGEQENHTQDLELEEVKKNPDDTDSHSASPSTQVHPIYNYKEGSQMTLAAIPEKKELSDMDNSKKPESSMYNLPNQSSIPLHHSDPTFFQTTALSQRIQDQFDHIFHEGRPNIQEEVSKFMVTGKGSMAVVSCGPPSFIDYIRSSIVNNIKHTDHRVDYFEEAFSW